MHFSNSYILNYISYFEHSSKSSSIRLLQDPRRLSLLQMSINCVAPFPLGTWRSRLYIFNICRKLRQDIPHVVTILNKQIIFFETFSLLNFFFLFDLLLKLCLLFSLLTKSLLTSELRRIYFLFWFPFFLDLKLFITSLDRLNIYGVLFLFRNSLSICSIIV